MSIFKVTLHENSPNFRGIIAINSGSVRSVSQDTESSVVIEYEKPIPYIISTTSLNDVNSNIGIGSLTSKIDVITEKVNGVDIEKTLTLTSDDIVAIVPTEVNKVDGKSIIYVRNGNKGLDIVVTGDSLDDIIALIPDATGSNTSSSNSQYTESTFYDYDIVQQSNNAFLNGVGRDGAGIFRLGDFVYVCGGWNGNQIGADVTANEVYRMPYDDLSNVTKIANAPWFRRHTFGCKAIGDKVYVWGADVYSGTSANDMWEGVADAAGVITWAKIGDLPYTNRILSGHASDGERYLYTVGGQKGLSDFSTATGDVWRFDTQESVYANAWVKVGNDRSDFRKNFDGNVAIFNGNIEIISGGAYTTEFTKKRFTSSDGGATFIETELPFDGVQYPSTFVYDDKLFCILGATNPLNESVGNLGVTDFRYMDKGGNWYNYNNTKITARHAACALVSEDAIIVVGGSGSDYPLDSWVVSKKGFAYAIQDSEVEFKKVQTTNLISDTLKSIGDYEAINDTLNISKTGKIRVNKTDFSGAQVVDIIGAHFRIGCNEGSGGGNLFESKLRTNNAAKVYSIQGPSFADADARLGLLSAYCYGTSFNVMSIGGDAGLGLGSFNKIEFHTSGKPRAAKFESNGYFSLGLNNDVATALLDVGGGSASVAPLRLRTQVDVTSPSDGSIWNNGTDLVVRLGGVNYKLTKTTL